jgi:hypothetical protein
MGFDVDRAPYIMVVDMVTIKMGGEDIGILPAEDFIGKFLSDLVSLFSGHFVGLERLDQMPTDDAAPSLSLVEIELKLQRCRFGYAVFR